MLSKQTKKVIPMSLADELKPIFTRKGLLLLNAGILSSLIWILHFSLEFKAIEGANLPPVCALFQFFVLPIGSFIYFLLSSKRNHNTVIILFYILLALSMAGLAVITDQLTVIVLLIVAGLCSGYAIPLIFALLGPFSKIRNTLGGYITCYTPEL